MRCAPATVLNTIDQTFPQVQFFTIGLELAGLLPTHVLTLSIDQGGDGGDGWAVDFLTVGVTVVPAPGSLMLLSITVPCGRHAPAAAISGKRSVTSSSPRDQTQTSRSCLTTCARMPSYFHSTIQLLTGPSAKGGSFNWCARKNG